ncbi:two-component system, OmpR family, phosphate regulon response regulator PhoB/two-component system, OmpR family, alkaline phosphatase synthesis response regulator PhoP [Chitinophaga sp. YR627]|uniref:response regulator transcription factor n=1 Tax=Chitinophaga sp. YR627 TaxID=1881041 RepID=UPI0008E51F9C|nr:response regulator [Chitinophaga sp. YR627]SFM84609.1 two-component system, OmpR family, phosphate regulon response regulator PhoB/two-component system, OmpR family, alkaline phosphatase synthesis response regulator PhoP [Chitinophaga sp. YR627]
MKHIVLVEDDEPIRFIFQVAFKSDNYHLISLESGEKIINEELDAPDLFILDKQIAGVNGLDICRFVKSSDKFGNVPVIIISADVDIVAQAREAGADDAIPKPFSLRTLRETVTKYSPETVTAVDTDR